MVVEILTGRDKGAERRAKLAALAKGDIKVLVGTHALFQEGVEFAHLRLAVIDEQHRFGVAERGGADLEGPCRRHAGDRQATPIFRRSSRILADLRRIIRTSSVLDEKAPPRHAPRSPPTLVNSGAHGRSGRALKTAVAEGTARPMGLPPPSRERCPTFTAADRALRAASRGHRGGRGGPRPRQMPPRRKGTPRMAASRERARTRVLVATTRSQRSSVERAGGRSWVSRTAPESLQGIASFTSFAAGWGGARRPRPASCSTPRRSERPRGGASRYCARPRTGSASPRRVPRDAGDRRVHVIDGAFAGRRSVHDRGSAHRAYLATRRRSNLYGIAQRTLSRRLLGRRSAALATPAGQGCADTSVAGMVGADPRRSASIKRQLTLGKTRLPFLYLVMLPKKFITAPAAKMRQNAYQKGSQNAREAGESTRSDYFLGKTVWRAAPGSVSIQDSAGGCERLIVMLHRVRPSIYRGLV